MFSSICFTLVTIINDFSLFTFTFSYQLRQRDDRYPTASTIAASQSPRFVIPQIISELEEGIKSKFTTHSLQGISNYAKTNILESYETMCSINNCYICNRPEIESWLYSSNKKGIIPPPLSKWKKRKDKKKNKDALETSIPPYTPLPPPYTQFTSPPSLTLQNLCTTVFYHNS